MTLCSIRSLHSETHWYQVFVFMLFHAQLEPLPSVLKTRNPFWKKREKGPYFAQERMPGTEAPEEAAHRA